MRWLAAGALLAWSSSFGQTYFIALSAGHIQETFGLSHGGWGAIYTAGTLMSAVLLVQVGRLADRMRVRSLALITIAGFVAVCLAMAAVPHWALLILVVFGLRFCGQGMMSHLALTAMGRWFRGNRGRAVATASLGFSMGEALLPLAFVLVSGVIGWRLSWVVAAGCLVFFSAPLLYILLKEERSPQSVAEFEHSAGMGGRHWTRGEAMRHWLFWALMPGVLAPSFIVTAIFFYQVHLTGVKGWPLASYVALYPVYSIGAILANFIAGLLADRYGAARLLPAYMLPLGVGLLILGLSQSFWLAPVALVCVGISQGTSQAMLGSIWPEYFGTRYLGSIRAAAVAGTVFASAIGPGITGLLLDWKITFEVQCIGMAIYVAIICFFFVGVFRFAEPLRPKS